VSATLRAVIVALVVGTVLYVMLDSRMVNAEPAPWFFSVSLGGLGLLFGIGAWATSAAGQSERSPLLAGLSLGVIGYALVRLVLF
jgi:ABC-type nickel/cobalt efflux system permease component RcnA